MQQSDFLVEIQTEELPPKSLNALAQHFTQGVKTRLEKTGLTFTTLHSFATPRRLAILIEALSSTQADKTVDRKGPALDKAYDVDGTPTQACLGFARSCGIDVKELITLPGNFVGYQQKVAGKTVAELLPTIIEEALNTLPIAKPMRWGSYSHKFIRPVHSVILLYGDTVIPAEILGCKTDRITTGHRFLHPEAISIAKANDYESALENAFVIPSFEKRKTKILQQIQSELQKQLGDNAAAHIEPALLDEVTSIVEWPAAVIGNFDPAFLQVPQEALISSMQDHQRYFPVVDKTQKLLPHFITISNITSADPKRISAGNERVLRARLSDAKFFFDSDQKTALSARVEKLKTIIFQNKLGTLFDKTLRVQKLAAHIAMQMQDDTQLAERAAYLAKTDLTTDLVGEFPELQGIAGYYYALNDKEPNTVAIALNEQYLPRFSGDKLPETKTGCALAIADRLDTLVGVFGINQAPTGDKDPFGLRRAALGILRILIEKQFSLDLSKLIQFAVNNFAALENKNAAEDSLTFILERLKPWYQEQNISTNVIASVMTLNLSNPYDIHRRIQAVVAFKNLPEAESLSVANKRVSNILAKYTDEITSTVIHENLFDSEAEHELARKLVEQEKNLLTHAQAEDYNIVLSQLSHLRTPVDNFFDQVMVMADDKAKRENRLLMLKKLRGLFLHVADIALLQ